MDASKENLYHEPGLVDAKALRKLQSSNSPECEELNHLSFSFVGRKMENHVRFR